MKAGRDLADAAVAQKLYSRALGYSMETKKWVLYHGEQRELPHIIHYPPDVQACIFWLRNRRSDKWLERAKPVESGLSFQELEEASERVRQSYDR